MGIFDSSRLEEIVLCFLNAAIGRYACRGRSSTHLQQEDLMLTTRFTELVGCSVPIQQAGMGGVATPPLAAAVTNAGGLGTVAGVGMPAAALAAMLDALRAQAQGPFGVN